MLRPYQVEALDAIRERWLASQATLAVLATGTGKSVLAAHAAKERAPLGRTIMIAHREELIDQGAGHLGRVTGLPVDIEMGERWSGDGTLHGGAPIVMASVQSLCSGTRMERFDPHSFATLIYDEAHHIVSDTGIRVVEYFKANPNLRILGLTATPDRHDEEALGRVFDSCCFDYEIIDAVMDGWLVRPLCRTVRLAGLDLSNVKTTAGDFNARQLADELAANQNLEAIAAATIEHSGNRQTLVFADSVTEAVRDEETNEIIDRVEGNAPKLTVMLNGHKPGSARLIHGGTPKDERRIIVDDYRHARFQFLVNVGVATEGFDAPDISCVVLGRPTKSRALCAQMVGRGTRPASAIADELGRLPNDVARRQLIAASAKPDLLIVDFVDNTNRHDLIHPPDILGGRVSDRAVDLVERDCLGMPVDVIDALAKADADIRHNDELAAAARNRQGVKAVGKSADRDPFLLYGLSRRTRRGWEDDGPAEDWQLEKLRSWKLIDDKTQPLTVSDAQQIIDEQRSRARRGLCTLRQARLLKRFGYDQGLSFDQAHAIIDQLAANGWKR